MDQIGFCLGQAKQELAGSDEERFATMEYTLLSRRDNFKALFSIDLVGYRLTSDYAQVLRKGFGLIYKGQLNEFGIGMVPSTWGWEVNYVNGRSPSGEPSCLGYTLFLEKGTYTPFDWLFKPPDLFISLFGPVNKTSRDSVQTSVGNILCFKEAGMPRAEKATFWYASQSSLLVKAAVYGAGSIELAAEYLLQEALGQFA